MHTTVEDLTAVIGELFVANRMQAAELRRLSAELAAANAGAAAPGVRGGAVAAAAAEPVAVDRTAGLRHRPRTARL